MLHSQSLPPEQRQQSLSSDHSSPRRHHPVLTPALLLSGSVILSIVSLFSEDLFPVLTLIGISAVPLALSIALVLGIAGILVSIISILESIDQHGLQTAMFPKPKEQGL
jgi:hypothetical protein